MRRLGRVGGGGPPGQLDKLLLIVIGLVVVALVRFLAPEPVDRPLGSAATPTATPRAGLVPGPADSPTPAPDLTPTPETARAPTVDPPYWRVNADGGVNMRTAPSTSASIALRLPDQEVITNLDRQQQADGLLWRNVALGDIEGWVAAEYLEPQYD